MALIIIIHKMLSQLRMMNMKLNKNIAVQITFLLFLTSLYRILTINKITITNSVKRTQILTK